jgi:hypothetical protein
MSLVSSVLSADMDQRELAFVFGYTWAGMIAEVA